MQNSTEKQKPYLKRLMVLCTVLFVSLATWVVLDYGKWRTIYQEMANVLIKQPLNSDVGYAEENLELKLRIDKLQGQLVVLQRSTQIDQHAYAEMERELQVLQNDNVKLREDLGFYKAVIAETKDNKELKIQGFRLEKADDNKRFHFTLVLTRMARDGRVSKGNAAIHLIGEDIEGKSVQLNILELTKKSGVDLSFSFKNFHRIEGTFSLPELFQPKTVRVNLFTGKENQSLETIFNWSEIYP